VRESLELSTNIHAFIHKRKSRTIVHADKFRIYQVLTNLLTNAIKYSPKGGEIIFETTKKKDKIQVMVKDNGIGISDKQKTRVFEHLYRAGGMEQKTFPGLGIGLFISKEIVERHGGEIWVESTVGKGSNFYFTLPLKA
jgi:signal transduction histidine kinase